MYFQLPGAPGTLALLASCHADWDGLPALWRILLALGEPGTCRPPLGGQAAPPSATMSTRATDALARLAVFNAFLLHHPLLHRIPQLPVFLDSVLDFLNEKLAAFASEESEAILLVVQIGSTNWPEDLPEYARDLRAMWQQLDAMAATRQFHALDEVLGFAESRESFGQWRAWANGFGLETLNAPYFRALEYGGYWTAYHAAPPAQPYKPKPLPVLPHDRREGAIPTWMGRMLQAGMRLLGMLPPTSAYKGTGYLPESSVAYKRANELAIEGEGSDEDDDNVLPDPDDLPGPSEFAQWRHAGVHSFTEAGKVGLRSLIEQDGNFFLGDVVLAPEWDQIGCPFEDRAWAKRDGKYSLIALANPCVVLLTDCCDHVQPYRYDESSCIVGKDGQFGVVNWYAGRISVAAEYDEIKLRSVNFKLTWHVRKGALWGVLDEAGVQVQPLMFERIARDDRDDFTFNERGYLVVHDGRTGWISAKGLLEVQCAWDEVRPCRAPGLFAVRLGQLWGLVTGDGQQWLPCAYLHVNPVAMAAHYDLVAPYEFGMFDDATWPQDSAVHDYVAASDPARANVLIAVRTASGVGLVDQGNRLVVPCKYRNVEVAKSGGFPDARWLIVVGNSDLFGVIDIASGNEIIPCTRQWLGMVVAPDLARPMVWTDDGEVHRLHYLDGCAAFDADLRWIGGDYDLDKRKDDDFIDYATGKLTERWHKGKPVRALLAGAHGAADRVVLLQPGCPILNEDDALADAFVQRGDITAALALADKYFYGDGLPKDLARARQWYGRACGFEARPVSQSAQAATDSELDGKQREEAACRFAEMVYQGKGGPKDAVLARHWAEVASTVDASRSDAATSLLLARILLDDGNSEADATRACALLAQIDAPSREEGVACHYRAVCLRDGRGVEQDWDLALMLFVRADACGVYQAAEAIADLLRNMANGAVPLKTALLLIDEANYYEKKFQESEEEDSIE
jgi:TPR repeat protein